MRASVWVTGSTDELIDDLCAAMSDALPWGIYGETILPESTLPLDTPDGAEARLEIGSLVVSTDPNQGAPEYEDGSGVASVSEVRIRLEQPLSQDLADRKELLRRRRDIRDVLVGLRGTIDMALILTPETVKPVTGRSFSSSFSRSFS